jgi:hypothetical protein
MCSHTRISLTKALMVRFRTCMVRKRHPEGCPLVHRLVFVEYQSRTSLRLESNRSAKPYVLDSSLLYLPVPAAIASPKTVKNTRPTASMAMLTKFRWNSRHGRVHAAEYSSGGRNTKNTKLGSSPIRGIPGKKLSTRPAITSRIGYGTFRQTPLHRPAAGIPPAPPESLLQSASAHPYAKRADATFDSSH